MKTTTLQRDPTTAEFLALNPLPQQLSHLEPTVKQLPFSLLMELIIGSAECGLDDAQICNSIEAAVDFATQSQYRCGCCLGWTDFDHTFAVLDGEQWHFGACCAACEQKIRRGNATKAMASNMRAYLRGGAR